MYFFSMMARVVAKRKKGGKWPLVLLMGGCLSASEVALASLPYPVPRGPMPDTVRVAEGASDADAARMRCQEGIGALPILGAYHRKKAVIWRLLARNIREGRNETRGRLPGGMDGMHLFGVSRLCVDIENEVMNILFRRMARRVS